MVMYSTFPIRVINKCAVPIVDHEPQKINAANGQKILCDCCTIFNFVVEDKAQRDNAKNGSIHRPHPPKIDAIPFALPLAVPRHRHEQSNIEERCFFLAQIVYLKRKQTKIITQKLNLLDALRNQIAFQAGFQNRNLCDMPHGCETMFPGITF